MVNFRDCKLAYKGRGILYIIHCSLTGPFGPAINGHPPYFQTTPTSTLKFPNTTLLFRQYLNENPTGLGHRLQKIVRRPPQRHQRIPQLCGRHQIPELDHTPGQHCGGEGHREPELDVVSGVVVAAGEVDAPLPAIGEP